MSRFFGELAQIQLNLEEMPQAESPETEGVFSRFKNRIR